MLPLTVVVLLVAPRNTLTMVWPVVASAGVIFFLTHWVRDRCLRVQTTLMAQWGGWPTMAMLRPTDGPDSAIVKRRRPRLEHIIGIPLPPPSAGD